MQRPRAHERQEGEKAIHQSCPSLQSATRSSLIFPLPFGHRSPSRRPSGSCRRVVIRSLIYDGLPPNSSKFIRERESRVVAQSKICINLLAERKTAATTTTNYRAERCVELSSCSSFSITYNTIIIMQALVGARVCT